jgi:hypothetical protein
MLSLPEILALPIRCCGDCAKLARGICDRYGVKMDKTQECRCVHFDHKTKEKE